MTYSGQMQTKRLAWLVGMVVASYSMGAYAVPGVVSRVNTGAQAAAAQSEPPAPAPTQPDVQTDKPATDTASATTSVPEETPALDTSKDPSENFNRAMFTFNEYFDKYMLKPTATLYNKVMPRPLNEGLHNAYNNIRELPTIANDILQVNIYQMTNDLWRLGVNTTVGIGGLFDVATRIKLGYYENDFGLTLATYGYDDSSFLVLPFLGPTTWRDGVIGFPVDYLAFSIYPYIRPESTRYELYALGVVDRRAQALQIENLMEEAAIDKYVFSRDAYMQRRAYQIKQNQHLGYDERDDQSGQDVPAETSQET